MLRSSSEPSDTAGRAEQVEEAIEAWLAHDALLDLVEQFGGMRDLRSVTIDAHRSGSLAQSLSASQAWLGREVPSPANIDRFRAEHDLTALESLVAALYVLEEFADAAWNFRSGTPALVRQLASAGGPPTPRRAPLLLQRMTAGRDRERLLTVYLGSGASALPGTLWWPDRQSDSVAAYRERWDGTRLSFDEAEARAVVVRASELGLVSNTAPGASYYDHVVILGGAGLAPLVRSKYVRDLLAAESPGTTSVWCLGSGRRIESPAERRRAGTYAPRAVDEFDLMVAAVRDAFMLDESPFESVCGCEHRNGPCPAWLATRTMGVSHQDITRTPFEMQHEVMARFVSRSPAACIVVLSACTSNPPLRTNTADTLQLFAKRAELEAKQRSLIVTSPVCVPFQTFDAMRTLYLPHGVDVDVIGVGARRSEEITAPEPLLQDLLSAVRSARRLASDAVELQEHAQRA
jgi:hypothetical protein